MHPGAKFLYVLDWAGSVIQFGISLQPAPTLRGPLAVSRAGVTPDSHTCYPFKCRQVLPALFNDTGGFEPRTSTINSTPVDSIMQPKKTAAAWNNLLPVGTPTHQTPCINGYSHIPS
eukprot:XP_011675973.1 PREDICTED: uncharacterized protein LOC105443964 [Strongylocentrotus purpuratus]